MQPTSAGSYAYVCACVCVSPFINKHVSAEWGSSVGNGKSSAIDAEKRYYLGSDREKREMMK